MRAGPRCRFKGMDESEKLWLGRFERCVEATRAWEPRIAAPDQVTPGSSLAEDDKDLVTAPVRTAAWSGLLSAVDHLALVADLAREELAMRPTSLFIPTRAALLGASQAVWVLSGNRPLRRARGFGNRGRRAGTAPNVPEGLRQRRVRQGELQAGVPGRNGGSDQQADSRNHPQ
jgi:hypothetical protein